MDLSRLKRFDKDKHEQLEQLIAWSQLMGLTGKDLVSLGGHIARAQAREETERNISLVDSMGCEPIGKDGPAGMSARWKFTQDGVVWHCVDNGSYAGSVKITNTKTKVAKTFRPGHHELGRISWHSGRGLRYRTMLDISEGKILLNF